MSTFYLAVIAAAWWGGLGPGLLAVVLSVLAANVFFIGVPGGLGMPQLHQWMLMVTFVTVNVLVCLMVEALHRARRGADTRAREIREKHDALKRALAERQQAEESFRAVFETVAVGMVLLEPQTGSFLRVNRYFCQITGYSEEELKGMTVRDLTHPEGRDEHFEAFQRMARGDTASYIADKRYVRKDGQVIWINVNGMLVHDAASRPRHVVSVMLDITWRKREEERMQRREEAVLALATTQSENLEGRIRQVTEAAAGALDVERVSVWLYTADRLAIQCEDLYTRSKRKHERGSCLARSRYPSYFAAMTRGAPILADDARAHEATAEFGEGYLDSLGIISMLDVPIWVGGRQAGVVCYEHTGPARHWSADDQEFAASLATTVALALEAEQRRLAEETARESGERFRTLADNISQLAWMTNERGWTFWHNQRWLDFVGMTLEEMRGWRWQQFLHPAHVVRVTEKFRHHIDRGKVWEDTYPLRGRDGSYRWFLSQGIPIRDAQGNVQRWFGTNTDVTEQRKREEELREVDRHKSEFLAMLGHELRNPLAAIRNALVLCQVEHESFDWAKGVVDRQSAQLARLVDDLLDVSRITLGKVTLRRERVEVCAVVWRAVEAAKPIIAQRGHDLSVECPPHELWVDADPSRLDQIVGNLLTNAAKYTEPGGKIWVTAAFSAPSPSSSRPETGTANREAEEKDGEPPREITITVRDTGVGIPPEKLPQMFDIFTQAERSLDRAEGGMGLGLAIVKMLTEMHGGRVDAWSAGLGKGSTFSIHLSAASAPVAGTLAETGEPGRAAPAPNAALPLANSKGKRVLVVDDNADAAEALGRLLRRAGCELEIALDGPTALDRAHEFHPTAVLLDIGLPGMDGYEVARRLRAEEHEEHALLVAVTGYGQEEDRRRSREAGFDFHLVKPVDIGKIQQLLENTG